MTPRKNYEWKLKSRSLRLGDRTLIMGSVNVAPDSGSGGRFTDPDRAFAQAMLLEEQGADVIELAAETLKPNVNRIAEAEELRRLIPVVKLLKDKLSVPLCVSTWKAAVADKALEHGAEIISDPSGMAWDPPLSKIIIKYDAGLILVHLRGTPDVWAGQPPVKDLMSMVNIGLGAAYHRAIKAGIAKEAMVIDPGIGLGKRREQNLDVINQLGILRLVDRPILVCTSRKPILAKPDATQLEFASAAMMTAAILNGAHMVRVHDVKAMKAAVEATDLLVAAIPGPPEPPPRPPVVPGPKGFAAREDSDRRPLRPLAPRPRES
ncbi:MAG: dihydropteroate synthase [Bryobacteraceae bacterium]|nr:dihydropteroate synthase [Bryobacteraceae bacterium]